MKTIKLTLAIALLGILISSCDKNPFDHRNKYVGDYQFEIEVTEYTMGTLDTTFTMTCFGDIEKDNDNENFIKLNTPCAGTFTLEITDRKAGTVESCGGLGDLNSKGRNTTIQYDYSSGACAGSGLGGNTTYSISGTLQI